MEEIKTINGLMKYLRDKHGIIINGSKDKQNLKNIGYFHGFKGYRYIKSPSDKISFTNFDELMAIINFDNRIKAMFYPHIMFLETAFKSYILENVLIQSKSKNFNTIYSDLMTDYKKHPYKSDDYQKSYGRRLDTYNKIHSEIASSYNHNNNIITHYIKKDELIPIWAIFEILSLGEFARFTETLNLKTKFEISKDIGINGIFDKDGSIIPKSLYILKDLRNAIAHNNIVFDTRFKSGDISHKISNMVEKETGINTIDFNSITDYLVFVIYYLKLFKKPKTELRKLINDFCKYVEYLKK